MADIPIGPETPTCSLVTRKRRRKRRRRYCLAGGPPSYRYFPEQLVSATVIKLFTVDYQETPFQGIVTKLRKIDFEGVAFTVTYSDGDIEDIIADDLSQWLCDPVRRRLYRFIHMRDIYITKIKPPLFGAPLLMS